MKKPSRPNRRAARRLHIKLVQYENMCKSDPKAFTKPGTQKCW